MEHGGNVWQGASPDAWLDYSANIRPEGAPEWVKDVIADAMDKVSYYPDPEMKSAKAALAKYLDLPVEFVLPAAGGISAINMAAHLDCTGMWQFAPCFAEYGMLGANRGKTMENISLLSDGHAIGDPAEKAFGRLHEGCAVWLCNPLNPVGCAFNNAQMLDLLRLIEEKHGWLIVDEAFIEYCPEHSVTALISQHERLVVTGSMTKILGIPGVRLGYLCAQPHVLKQLSKYQLTWELSCFAEAVLCALPEHKADIMRDCELNVLRREQLKQGLEKLGVFVYPSNAAFVLCEIGMPVEGIIDKLKSRGILVRHCMNFDGINDGRHLRLAVKDTASNARLIRELEEAMICAGNH